MRLFDLHSKLVFVLVLGAYVEFGLLHLKSFY